MTTSTLYSITPTDTRDQLAVTQQAQVELANEYTSMVVLEVGGRTLLLGYHRDNHHIDTYVLTGAAPWVEKVDNHLELGGPAWDVLDPFVIGDKPHLMTYEATKGEFAFFPITDDLHALYPLHLSHPREPFTTNFTMVKMLETLGQVFVMGYNHVNGDVNIWTVSVTARSDGKHPPLDANVAWAHRWAQGWTRFAFFQWGAENFFLKTNTWKPNVNIDHIPNALGTGTNEVGSWLELQDAQQLDIVHPFAIGSDPYFLTYMAKTGKSTFNRVHGSCKAWTIEAQLELVGGATHIVPYVVDGKNYALYV